MVRILLLSCLVHLAFAQNAPNELLSPHFAGVDHPAPSRGSARPATLNGGESRTPSWANWNFDPFVLKINKQALGKKVFAFGIVCTSGTNCDTGMAEAPPVLVRLELRDNNLLLVPVDSPAAPPALRPIVRWIVEKEDGDFIFAKPNPNERLSLLLSLGGLNDEILTQVYDRFFHDFRTDREGLWFHETIRYEYWFEIPGFPATRRFVRGTDTFSMYLIADPFDPDFAPKAAIPQVGFFINGTTWEDQSIYSLKEAFNPKKLKAIHWGNHKEMEWILDRKIPEVLTTSFEQGILDWSAHLPTLRIRVRRAEEEEELDSPYKNVVNYKIVRGFGGAYANFAYSLKTGEIFRGGVTFFGTEKIPGEGDPEASRESTKWGLTEGWGEAGLMPSGAGSLRVSVKYNDLILQHWEDHFPFDMPKPDIQKIKNYTRAVMSHEIGHVLGLRHNFKGSLYATDVEHFSQGSSIMEYCTEMDKGRIGPYDVEAVQWAHYDKTPSSQYPFCADEAVLFDPQCHRFDVTTANVFDFYYPKLQRLLSVLVPSGVSFEERVSAYNVLYILPNLRSPEELFYNEDRFDKTSELFQIVAGYTLKADPKGNAVQWAVASLLVSGLEVGSFLRYQDLFAKRDPFFDFLDWVARVPGKKAFHYRQEIVKKVSGWKKDPYGLLFTNRLRERLGYHAEHSEQEAVRVENQFLLGLL